MIDFDYFLSFSSLLIILQSSEIQTLQKMGLGLKTYDLKKHKILNRKKLAINHSFFDFGVKGTVFINIL